MGIKNVKVWAAASKWKKYQILSSYSFTKKFLPETDLLTKQVLWDYLEKFSIVYLKPDFGSGGYGIMKVTKQNQAYEVRTNRFKKIFKHKYSLLQCIRQFTGQKPYIIQQGINLLTIDQQPIDFRVLLLKPDKKWEVMGIMGKLGKKEKIVTNFCQGAKAIPLQTAITRSNIEDEEIENLEEILSTIGVEVADLVSSRYKYVREIGLDVAIDKDENIWIIEANTRPNFKLFKYHPDKTLYSKIYRLIKQIRFK